MVESFSPLTSHLSPLFWFLLGYFSGSIPTGYWLGKLKGIDLTEIGSGSIGATNVLRSLGTGPALLTLFLDTLKGFVPVYFCVMFQNNNLVIVITGIACILGHSKSIFLKFKGGKSSATGLGILLGLCWQAGLITFLIWSVVVVTTKYSSLGSIISIPLTPVWLLIFHKSPAFIIFGLFAAVYIVLIRHRENIRRLLQGTEPKLGQK